MESLERGKEVELRLELTTLDEVAELIDEGFDVSPSDIQTAKVNHAEIFGQAEAEKMYEKITKKGVKSMKSYVIVLNLIDYPNGIFNDDDMFEEIKGNSLSEAMTKRFGSDLVRATSKDRARHTDVILVSGTYDREKDMLWPQGEYRRYFYKKKGNERC